MQVYEYVVANNILSHSAINNKEFRDFFKDIKIKTIVEIGTYKGISTAYMAGFADKVYTFDIMDYPEKYKVWDDLEVNNKIFFYIVKSRHENNIVKNFEGVFAKNKNALNIKGIIDRLEFDFAFIDGQHDYKNVKADFELVKRCGRVLFHDVDSNIKSFVEIRKFVDEIKSKIKGNIAYWEKA